MAIEDLDLEFEDEGVEKSSGIIEIGEELSFNAGAAGAQKGKAMPTSQVKKAPTPQVRPKEVQSPAQTKPKVSASDRTNPNLVLPKNFNDSPIEPTFNNPISNENKVRDLGVERQRRGLETKNLASEKGHSSDEYDIQYASSDEVQFLREEVERLRQEMVDVKVEAEVRARLAEEKAKFMIESVTETKMMNHQMMQVLQRIHAKVPGLKNEVLMAKKILDEFVKKTSK